MFCSLTGEESPTHHLQSHCVEPLNTSNLFTCPLDTSNLCSLYSLSGTTDSDINILNKYMNNSNTGDRDSDVMCTTSSVSDKGLLITNGSCASSTITASSPDHMSINVSVLTKDNSDEGNGGMSETEQDGRVNNTEEEERNKDQPWNREDVEAEDVREGGHAGEKRGTLMTQTTDRADRQECGGGDTRKPKTEIKDRVEREKTETPEPEIQAQTTDDKNNKYEEKSNTLQVVDFMVNTETPLAACEPSEFSQSLCQVIQKDADSTHVNKGGIGREGASVCIFSSDESPSVNQGCNPIVQEVQRQNIEERQSDQSVADCPDELSGFSSQMIAVQSADYDLQTPQIQTEAGNLLDTASKINPTDQMHDTKVNEESVLLRTMTEPQARQCQEISEQENEQLTSLVTDSVAHNKSDGQTNMSNSCETAKKTMEKSDMKDASDNVDPKFQVETGSCLEHLKHDKQDVEDLQTAESETNLKPSVRQSYSNDVSPETNRSECHKQPVKELPLDYTIEMPLPSSRTYRSSFDWSGAKRKTAGSTTTSVSVLHQFAQVLQLKA